MDTENGHYSKDERENFIKAMRSPLGRQFIDEVLGVERERPPEMNEVFVAVPPEHFFAAAVAGVIFDEANRFRQNGMFLTEGAIRYLEEAGVPITRVTDEPQNIQKVVTEGMWETHTIEDTGNIQDAVQGQSIIRVYPRRISERAHKKLRTLPTLL